LPLAHPQLLQGSVYRLFNRVCNLFGILFRPAPLGAGQVDRAQLAGNYLALCVKYHRPAGVSALIDGEYVVHER
jgi:hypothetical protein